jgi:hypothetical protein
MPPTAWAGYRAASSVSFPEVGFFISGKNFVLKTMSTTIAAQSSYDRHTKPHVHIAKVPLDSKSDSAYRDIASEEALSASSSPAVP